MRAYSLSEISKYIGGDLYGKDKIVSSFRLIQERLHMVMFSYVLKVKIMMVMLS